jgi:oligopeptide transport system substrate-binding protein
MTKRIIALVLCIVMLSTCLFGCAKKDKNYTGAYITMYLTDNIYDFDPAKAYYNSDAVNVLGLMYETLFTLNSKGKIKKQLVEKYTIVENAEENEYYIEFQLREDARWSVNEPLTANDVVYAWKRLVDFRNGFEAASLLYDIKNARAVKEGDISVDALGVEAVEDYVVKVSFEAPIDYDRFLLNLTSVATAPLLQRYVESDPDWAKKSSSIATSGPFKLGKVGFEETGEKIFDDNKLSESGKIVSSNSNKVKRLSYFNLDRNPYYYRDVERDAIDKTVKPYKILVDCSKSDAEILDDYKNGKIFYIGNIPLSLRNGADAEYIKKQAKVSDSLSTFVCQFNENALIADGGTGTYLFANPKVRQALSLALDRNAIAQAIVFAEAATALVPPGVFEKLSPGFFERISGKGEFQSGELATTYALQSSPNKAAAQALLAEAGITPENFSFSIKVAAYDEIHVAIVEMIKNAWCDLGFNVTVEKSEAIENNDYLAKYDSTFTDICDDQFMESIERGKFEVVAYDQVAFSADAFSVLSNYAYAFSGEIYADMDQRVFEYQTHMTGYDSIRYNILIEAAYYLPYFKNIDPANIPSNSNYQCLKKQPYVESAQSAYRKFNDSYTLVQAAIAELSAFLENDLTAFDPTANTDVLNIDPADLKNLTNALQSALESLELASKQAHKNVTAAQVSAEITQAAQASAAALQPMVSALGEVVTTLVTVVSAVSADDLDYARTAWDAVKAIVDPTQELLVEADGTRAAMMAVVDNANKITLYDAIKAVYAENGIDYTAKKEKKLLEYRAILLHKAEEQLMADMPVIPVIFNQNAILVHKDLKKVSSTYYTPANFRKTKLKNWDDYFFYNEDKKKKESIFKDFPSTYWDKIGR